MGARSERFFDEANRLGGIAAKARLASLARVTSTEAVAGADDDITVERLDGALQKLRDEYRRRQPATDSRVVETSDPAGSILAPPPAAPAAMLRAQLDCLAELMSQRGLVLDDPELTARRVDEACATQLKVQRVSVWLLVDRGRALRCLDLYEAQSGRHSSGTELQQADYAEYFEALESQRTIAVHDAVNDPRTRCFAESYLEPLGIGALLDVPIWAAGEMLGVICYEHVGGPRRWTDDEERFAYLMSGFVALAFERAAIRRDVG